MVSKKMVMALVIIAVILFFISLAFTYFNSYSRTAEVKASPDDSYQQGHVSIILAKPTGDANGNK